MHFFVFPSFVYFITFRCTSIVLFFTFVKFFSSMIFFFFFLINLFRHLRDDGVVPLTLFVVKMFLLLCRSFIVYCCSLSLFFVLSVLVISSAVVPHRFYITVLTESLVSLDINIYQYCFTFSIESFVVQLKGFLYGEAFSSL